MTIPELQQKILTDDAFVIEEVLRIQHLYGLKHEIRYAQKRIEDIRTESVAEHVYGMHVIAHYFSDLEDPEHKLNWARVTDMITWHDIGEIETGDMLGQLKTDTDRQRDLEGNQMILEKMTPHLASSVGDLLDEYEAAKTPEAKFAKAIDKTEVVFETYDENYRVIFQTNQTTKAQHEKTKLPYVKDFPYIKRFCEVTRENLAKQGFFVG